MSLAGKLKGALFQDEVGSPKPPTTPIGTPPIGTKVVWEGTAIPRPLAIENTPAGGLYPQLFDKTNFDLTPVGSMLKTISAPLDGVITDERTKFQAVFSIARTQNSNVAADVVSTLNNLTAILQNEQTNFDANATQFQAEHVDGPQARLKELQDEIARLAVELSNSQTKLTQKRLDFKAAYERRKTELASQKTKLSDLLGIKEIAR